jgi:hypothetical protein
MFIPKELRRYKMDRQKELLSGDYEGAEISKEIIEDVKMEAKSNKPKRYGFYPFLKPSSRRGQKVLWSDPDVTYEPEKNDWGLVKNKNQFEDFGKTKTQEFEKW